MYKANNFRGYAAAAGAAYAYGNAAYNAYKSSRGQRRSRVVRHGNGTSSVLPVGFRRRVPMRARTGQFNEGYTIVNRKAVNTKRRRRRPGKKARMRRARKAKVNQALICGKLLEHHYKRTVALNEIEVTRGRIAVPNVKDAASNVHYLPLQLIDITDLSTSQSGVGYSCYYTENVQDQYKFTLNVHQKTVVDGETANSDVYTTSGLFSTISEPSLLSLSDIKKWYYDKCDVSMLMYGQNNQDTLFRVDVVRFHPTFAKAITNGSFVEASQDANPSIGDWKEFWQSLIIPYTQNPLVKRSRGRFMKILKSFKFKIPEKSSEFDKVPCVKTKFTIPFKAVFNRYWHSSLSEIGIGDAKPEDPTELNEANYDDANNVGFGGGYVDPKWRTYLMIRATNTDQQTVADANTYTVPVGGDPTYDIRISGKWFSNKY